MKDLLETMLPELLRQAPSVVVLVVILLHQQQQINMLLEKCIVITQALP
jgi:hypothetical protein